GAFEDACDADLPYLANVLIAVHHQAKLVEALLAKQRILDRLIEEAACKPNEPKVAAQHEIGVLRPFRLQVGIEAVGIERTVGQKGALKQLADRRKTRRGSERQLRRPVLRQFPLRGYRAVDIRFLAIREGLDRKAARRGAANDAIERFPAINARPERHRE